MRVESITYFYPDDDHAYPFRYKWVDGSNTVEVEAELAWDPEGFGPPVDFPNEKEWKCIDTLNLDELPDHATFQMILEFVEYHHSTSWADYVDELDNFSRS